MSLLDTASLVITPNGTKAGKLYSVVPSSGAGDMTVVRNTTATRVNENGLIELVGANVPRLDYTNGDCPSILVEPQRTNLVTWSEDFTNASWVKANSNVTSNVIVSPDGNTTADYLIPNTSNTLHTATKLFLATAGVTTFSIFAKQGGYKNILVWFDVHSGGLGVNLDNLSIFRNQNLISHEVIQYPNGWVYISITANITLLSNPTIYIADNNLTPQVFFSGDGTSGVFIWGAQLEQGSYATSYIPTTIASVTRNADVISKTGISSLIGQTEGTLFVDFYHDGLANFNLSSISNGFYDDAIYFEMYLSNMYAVIWDSGSQQFAYNGGSLSIGRHKMAIAYKANDTVFYIDGVLKYTDTSLTIPTTARVDVGALANATIEKTENNLTALWKTRLTNSQLASLTTI